MRRNKIADLKSYSSIRGLVKFGELPAEIRPHFILTNIGEIDREIVTLNQIYFFSRANDKAELMLFFKSSGSRCYYDKESLLHGTNEFTSSLKRLIAPVKPIGQTSRRVEAMDRPEQWIVYPESISRVNFRVSIFYQRNVAERENLTEAFWRVLGDYLDVLEIPRQEVGKYVKLERETFVMVPYKEGGRKLRSISAMDYMRQQAGF